MTRGLSNPELRSSKMSIMPCAGARASATGDGQGVADDAWECVGWCVCVVCVCVCVCASVSVCVCKCLQLPTRTMPVLMHARL